MACGAEDVVKLAPLSGVVREPPAKRCAGRNILEPGSERQIDFPDSARPGRSTGNRAILRLRFVVDAFQSERFTPPLHAPDYAGESADQVKQRSGIDTEPNQQQGEDRQD